VPLKENENDQVWFGALKVVVGTPGPQVPLWLNTKAFANEDALIFTVPLDRSRSELTSARNCEALTKDVSSAVPFQLTTSVGAKPVPLTMRVKLAAPAATEAGWRLVIVEQNAGIVTTAIPAANQNGRRRRGRLVLMKPNPSVGLRRIEPDKISESLRTKL
jgi:hypothetical protein